MRSLVTGGAGFIGSHLADRLLARTDEELLLFDDFSSGSRANVEHLLDEPRVEIREGDIRDEEQVDRAVGEADRVYHLAAAVGVKKIVEDPLPSFETNVTGTHSVLEAARREEVPVFVASSSEVYGKSPNLPFSEEDDRVLGPVQVPRWSYATGKAADEFLALAYHEEYATPTVVGRFFNVVGPRQSSQYGTVVPRFIEQALAGEPLTVYDDGTQTRSFAHVADAVEAVHKLLTTEEASGEVFNVGAPDPVTINELAERVLERTGSDSPIHHMPLEAVYGDDFEEPPHRYPDTSKLEATIGTTPRSDLDRIIDDVVAERERRGLTV